MPLTLYNTLSREKEEFTPIEPGKVNLYACGPTVYDFAHIGNLRSFVMTDLLYRALKAEGVEVLWVMNVTDIDDKTIRATIEKSGKEATVADLRKFTSHLTKEFYRDLNATGVLADDITFINITDVIPDIQAFILLLIEKGYAYRAEDGSTYFSIERYQADFGTYGALVGPEFLKGKKIGARVLSDEYEKENLSDFALWKAWDGADADIAWEHPILGRGRPGWHIECSVVNHRAFPGGTDIHTGGIDLLFPHHTNEIAQSQPLQPIFVRHWMHGEYLQVEGKKMAKSAGNFYTLRDVEAKGFSGLTLRYFYLQTHYRQQMNFTWEALEGAAMAYKNLTERVAELLRDTTADKENSPAVELHKKAFADAVRDDLNMPKALATTWELMKDTSISAETRLAMLAEMDKILGLDLVEHAHTLLEMPVPAHVNELARLREKARLDKDWLEADRLRQEIEKLGWTVRDTDAGSTISKTQ